jgi:hypothetical protein
LPEGLGIAAGQGRNAAAALAGGEMDPYPVMVQNLEYGIGYLGIELVDEAAHEKGHLEVCTSRGGVPPGDLKVPGIGARGVKCRLFSSGDMNRAQEEPRRSSTGLTKIPWNLAPQAMMRLNQSGWLSSPRKIIFFTGDSPR